MMWGLFAVGLLVLIGCTALLIGFMRLLFYLCELGHAAVSPLVPER